MKEFGDLDQFNPAQAPLRPIELPAEIYVAPPAPDLWGLNPQTIIAFDQALANTGWVIIRYEPGIAFEALDVGTIKTSTLDDRVSWDDTLERATRLMGSVLELLSEWKPDLVLHEMPPVGVSPWMRATYASVVGATAVRCAAYILTLPVEHVATNAVGKYLTGNGRATKKERRAAIEKLIADDRLLFNSVEHFRFNEHIIDAIGIALTYRGTTQ